MQRSRIAHIVAISSIVGALACVTGTAWAKTAPTKAAPARSYVVRSGDGGWSQLAKAHHTTMRHLLAANHATAATPLKAGQRIQLPADARAEHGRAPATAHLTPAKRASKP